MRAFTNPAGATFVVLADTGHALPHERPDVLGALMNDWLAPI